MFNFQVHIMFKTNKSPEQGQMFTQEDQMSPGLKKKFKGNWDKF